MSMRIPGQIVVFAMMITGLAGAAAAQGNAPAVRSILVTGEGEASGPPDRAQVSAGVQTVAKSVAQASQENQSIVDAIMKALEQTRYNKTAAAKLLGLTFRALRYRIKKLGIE